MNLAGRMKVTGINQLWVADIGEGELSSNNLRSALARSPFFI